MAEVSDPWTQEIYRRLQRHVDVRTHPTLTREFFTDRQFRWIGTDPLGEHDMITPETFEFWTDRHKTLSNIREVHAQHVSLWDPDLLARDAYEIQEEWLVFVLEDAPILGWQIEPVDLRGDNWFHTLRYVAEHEDTPGVIEWIIETLRISGASIPSHRALEALSDIRPDWY